MPLIKCMDCGRVVSDMAEACPYCGRPIKVQSATGIVHFLWANMKGHTYLKTEVFLDGERIGIMKSGERLDFTLSSGSHIVELYFRKKCSVRDVININGSHEEYYAFKQTLSGLKRVPANSVKWNAPVPNGAINIPKCPTCGSQNIKKISLSSRSFSVGMVGIASSSIGKTFVCKNCGYKW